MNPENIHDALNLLPDDLIAEADALRQKPRKTIPWKQLIPMAACFALVLGALYVVLPNMATKDAAPEAAAPMEMLQDSLVQNSIVEIPETAPAMGEPMEDCGAPLAPDAEEAMEEVSGTPQIPVSATSYCIGSREPAETEITLISTTKEWNIYLAETISLLEAEGFENHYEEPYFEKNQLIAVVTTAASSSVRYEIHSIHKNDAGIWELTGIRHTPAEQTDDLVQQLILVELPRVVEPEDIVVLVTVDME